VRTWPGRARRAGLVLLTAAALTTGGVANAYFGGPGSGTGTAGTATTQDLQLSAATPTADLYPGGTSGVALTISNPNPHRVRVSSLGLDTTRGTDGFDVDHAHPGCFPLSVLTLVSSTNEGAGWDVPARAGAVDGTLAVSLPGALAMGTDAADGCQGATFTAHLGGGL
jgi:hypothetical protein